MLIYWIEVYCKLEVKLICLGFEYQSMSIGTVQSVRFSDPTK